MNGPWIRRLWTSRQKTSADLYVLSIIVQKNFEMLQPLYIILVQTRRYLGVCPTLLWILDSREVSLMLLRMKRSSLITLARSVCTVRQTGVNVWISNYRRFPKMCFLCFLYYFKKPDYQLARTLSLLNNVVISWQSIYSSFRKWLEVWWNWSHGAGGSLLRRILMIKGKKCSSFHNGGNHLTAARLEAAAHRMCELGAYALPNHTSLLK